MDQCIVEHGGRIANTAGDSILAEFPSAVDAVQCAVEVQRALANLNSDVEPDRALCFRIGIHVGDAVVRGGDLLGDSVNITSRLEGLAEPGGVCISDDAYRQVRKALVLSYTDLGPQRVKNIEEPVHAFMIEIAERLPANASTKPPALRPLPLPDNPSIAVLPFTNMSGDPEEYFADGIVEDIITTLSKVADLFVIARNSTFAFKGRTLDPRAVARDLGVRYVVEGSLRRSGNRIRVTAQLIDGQTGSSIWAERYDRHLEDIFTVQDEITGEITTAL
jgi:adenylate cyclase